MKYFVSTIFVILFISCNSTNSSITTYFGGEILNPKSKHVLLLKDEKVVDTLLLDSNNRFLAEYNSLNEGLYTFKHGNEFQYIYFEPADSILIRLNTWDFDESLVFSGKGGTKNEFLINLFLQNEKEEKAMYSYFGLDEFEFQKKIDSLSSERNSIYASFSENENSISEGFKKLTTTAIQFPLYRLKEIYPYYYKKAHKLDDFPSTSKEFYSFRKTININEESLVSFYPYQNYVISYLYNLSFAEQNKNKSTEKITNSLLHSIAENIELEEFKNTLLKKIVINDFLKSESTCTINKNTLNIFLENCTNPEYIKQVKNLVNDSEIVVNKQPLRNFEIESFTNENITINDIIKNQNTVIYFWSSEYMSSDYLVTRIKYLEKKYPNILFVGINMQPSFEDFNNDVAYKQLDVTKQFKLTENSYAHSYLASKYPRTIIVNKNGVVENGFTYLDSRKLNSELNRLK